MTNNELRDQVAKDLFVESIGGVGLDFPQSEIARRARAAFDRANTFMNQKIDFPNDWNPPITNNIEARSFIGAARKD